MNKQKSFITRFGELIDEYRAERRAAAPMDAPRRPGRLGRLLRWFLPNGGTLLLVALLILTQQVWAKPLLSPASVPGPTATTVNYQGRLADSGGTPLDGTYGMSFSLWDAATTGGSLVWGPEGHAAVPVSEGLFSVGLGSQTSGGILASAWNGDRYLEVTVGGETLTPRELIRSVPVAGMALTVPDGAIESRNARLSVGRVAASIPGGNRLELTNGFQDVPGTTFTLTPETDQTYLVYVTADFDVLNGLAVATLFIDGVRETSETIFCGCGARERGTVSQTYLVDLSAGTHTLVLKAKLNLGTSAKIYETHTTLTYFAVSQ